MILNVTKKRLISSRTYHAIGFLDRGRGMIGRRFQMFDAMVFPACSAIHTLFMGQRIDVLFVDAGNRIVRLEAGVAPWRLYLGCHTARTVVELPDGVIAATGTQAGDVLDLSAELSHETIKEWQNQSYGKGSPVMIPLGESQHANPFSER